MTKRTTAIVEQVLRDGEVSAETLASGSGCRSPLRPFIEKGIEVKRA